MTQITALVKSAMGFDQARGDQVQVSNMQFARVGDRRRHAGRQAAAGPGPRLLVQDHRSRRSCA